MKYVFFLVAFMCLVANAGVLTVGCNPQGVCAKPSVDTKKPQQTQPLQTQTPAAPAASNKPAASPINAKPEPPAKSK
jgi:hypothetical protein